MSSSRVLASASIVAFAWMGATSGCGDVEPRERVDAFVDPIEIDAAVASPDAYFGFDAPDLDAPFPDAFVVRPDAWSGMDAFSMDAFSMMGGTDAFWGTCTSGGRMGTCMPMSMCSGTSVRGLCPGPAEIQCCLPGGDAGMFDAPRPMGTYSVDEVVARLGACARIGGDYARDSGGTSDIPVCQTDDVIWWDADMDIDCDGGRGAECMSDPYYLPDTSAVDSMGRPLDASTLPFVVIPLPSTRFRSADHGIRHGQVALAMYRDRMVFGIFGDLGPAAIIGEASYAMAVELGIPPSPISGGVGSGVHYLIFTGAGARVTRNEDHDEAVTMGESLLADFMTP
ncbi:MAG: glycoside hydrolase family 75 protein [Deltaproteobacteria bacterium]|nr:glycoside hydrolase family 75 protein [Deltaproteobacteria bacterium]